jgi:hypothetical protein
MSAFNRYSEDYLERMRINAERYRAWWAAKPNKVFESDAERIGWRNAEAIAGRRVDRRIAYYLHDGKVMVKAWLLPCEDRERGMPVVTLEEYQP